MNAPFGRLVTAMVTPFGSDGKVNLEVARKVARHLINHGNDGVVVTGTTGESPTLTHSEKLALYEAVTDEVGKDGVVIAGTGTYNTAESVELTREATRLGVGGIMLVVPYYNNPPQEGLFQHFRSIAMQTELPVMLYNIPSRSPRNMEAATTLRLANSTPNIVAVKEASGKLEQVTALVKGAPDGFLVYSGDDGATLPLMSLGAHGVVSVAAHGAGKLIRQMIDKFVAGDPVGAALLHQRLQPFFDACFCTTNPIPIKAVMELLGYPMGGVRLPLVPASDWVITQVRREMESLHLL